MKYKILISIAVLIVVAIVAGLVLGGSQSDFDGPSPVVEAARLSPLSLHPSRFTIPISVPLETLGTLLEDTVPEKILGSDEIDYGIQMNWSITRSSFNVSQDNSNLMITSDLIGSAILKRRIVIEVQATVGAEGNGWFSMQPELSEDWKIIPNLTMGVNLSASEHRVFDLFTINLDKWLQPEMTKIVEQYTAYVESYVANSDVLERTAREEWTKLCRSMIVLDDPEMWLEIEPQSVGASQIRINNRQLLFQLEIDTDMRVSSIRTEPTCPFPEKLIIQPEKSGEFEINLLTEIGYDSLGTVLGDMVVGKSLGGGLPMIISEVALRPHGTSLLLELEVSAGTGGWLGRLSWLGTRARGRVYLFAKPHLSSDGQVISLREVELETGSRSAVLSVLGEAAEPWILDTLEGQTTFSLDTVSQQILERLNSSLAELSLEEISLDAKISDIQLTRLDVGPEYLRGVATLQGNAAVAIKEISLEGFRMNQPDH